jgi:RNA polymerase sigma-70 factor (ECF subfamily)
LNEHAPRSAPESDATSDERLIACTLAGEPAAFGQLVVRYQGRLYNALVRVLASAEDARDVAQDAFVQAFLKLDTFRGHAAFFTWLYRIAFNLAMSHARRGRHVESLDAAKDHCGLEPVDGQISPEAELVGREQVALVHRALAALSAEYRQIIVLRELEDCSYDQIAEILDLPIGTVRSRLFRARLALRDQLAPAMNQEASDVLENKL